mgnify:CR=1 FL=1
MINKYPCINIYENRKKNSKLSSQILYGEKFSIIRKYKDFYKFAKEFDANEINIDKIESQQTILKRKEMKKRLTQSQNQETKQKKEIRIKIKKKTVVS